MIASDFVMLGWLVDVVVAIDLEKSSPCDKTIQSSESFNVIRRNISTRVRNDFTTIVNHQIICMITTEFQMYTAVQRKPLIEIFEIATSLILPLVLHVCVGFVQMSFCGSGFSCFNTFQLICDYKHIIIQLIKLHLGSSCICHV